MDCEEQRAELAEVLDSASFKRAPTLAHLLSYLCEKLFAGESNEIKEYSIGVEVFHRGSSFDQDSNSIVRVEANRLRKRLAAYYASEGASHRLHIVIPVGQYVPEFLPAAVQTESSALANEKHEQPAHPENRQLSLSRRNLQWAVGSVGLVSLLLGLAYVRSIYVQQARKDATAVAYQPALQPAEAQVGPPAGDEVRILAGESRSFVDHAGKLWSADRLYSGGSAVSSNVWHISRTLDPDFYRTSRQGQFRYDIPLKKGIYELRLHFAETVYGPGTASAGGEGSRVMAVSANGQTLLSQLDVVADAGAGSTADVKVFHDISPASDGLLHLVFSGVDGKQALLSAIEILPGVAGHMRPVRLLARQTPYYSNDSQWWSPDNYFEGGQMASYSRPVSGTDDPELYETERWGNFSYAIPVPPGKYTVLLHFALRHGEDASSPGGDRLGRIFNVFCNGKVLLQNFDLQKEARQSDVVLRKATGLEPNAQGKLLLSFVPVQGYATVTGIEVLSQ
jgi:hypothetical protein